MFNGLLIALLFVLLPLAGRAQTMPGPRAAPDSAAAIKRLFRQRRLGAGMGLAVGCGSVAPGAASLPSPPDRGSQMLLPPGAVAGLGPDRSLLAMFSWMRFSYRREQQVLLRLARHQALPGYVQRALTPVFASSN